MAGVPRKLRVLRGCAIMLAIGVLLNLLVAWSLSFLPRWTGAAELRIAHFIRNAYDGPHTSVYHVESLWFGVHERQYYLTRRTRARPVTKRTSVYWTWLPFERDTGPIVAGNDLFARFEPEKPDDVTVSATRVGFPALSLGMESMVDDTNSLSNGTLATTTRGGFMRPIEAAVGPAGPGVWSHAQYVLLPYRPIWIGFAINTVFYTLIVMMIAWIVRQARHARRMRKGLCPYCAYELHHDFRAGCPECGWRMGPAQPEP